MSAVEVHWIGGGDGHVDGVATPGASLRVWDQDRWIERGSNVDGVGERKEVEVP